MVPNWRFDLMGLSHSPRIVTDGLVLCLDAANKRSYPGAGTTWTDLTANKNNATLQNSPSFNSANAGIFTLDGTNQRAFISNNDSFNFSDVISLSSWFNFNSLPGSELGLFRKTNQWQLGLQNSNTIRCLIGTYGTSGWIGGNDQNYTFVTGNWYNMTMTYDGSKMRIYVNGVLVKTATVTGTIATNTSDIQIGYHSAHLNGHLSNCAIYNSTLSASEVVQNYLATKGRFQ